MTRTQWFHDAVVYQVYPRSFADSDGDGIGDIRGIISKLDYLALLGVDVVWLSPVYASPQHDNGYDISDYYAIDPVFGDLQAVDDLISGLHERGMKLVMDLVVNHTSHKHRWFLESRSSRDNAKRDWYWWRDGGEDGTPPNNWGAAFSGSSWTLDERTGQYYLHLFSPQQPDLNWENPEVRHAIYEMMTWWLDRGVDGFRMDVVNFISKDPALPDGPVRSGAPFGDGGAYFISGPRIHEFLQEMHREVFAGRDAPVLTIGEMPGATPDEARLFTDPDRRELDMVFQFEHVELDHDGGKWNHRPHPLTALKRSLGRWQEALAEQGWNSLYWSNHDQPRAVSRFGDEGAYRRQSAKLLAGVLHLHRGTPFIYQGEELGMTNMVFGGIEDYRDIEAVNFYHDAVEQRGLEPDDVLARMAPLNRDNARTPVPWMPGDGAGFTTGEPWIAINPNNEEINARVEVADPDSVFHFYRRLIRLRHEDPVVAHGDFEMLLPDDERLYAYERRLGAEAIGVFANVGGATAQLPSAILERWGGARLILGNYPPDASPALRPWEIRILRLPA